jgi:uncharacterized damage-inducible protein DinB
MDATRRFQRLFDYDAWATRCVLDVLKKHPDLKNYKEALSLLGHLLSAQQIWYRRTVGRGFDDLELWPEHTLEECENILKSMPEKWSALLKKHKDDPDTPVAYKNTKGESYETKLSDILHHLIIHGQHHRAQIATLIRESGQTPPATDFIYFTWNHQ